MPVSPTIVKYAQKQKQSGYAYAAVRQTLLSSGYKQPDVDESLAMLWPEHPAPQRTVPSDVKPAQNSAPPKLGGFWLRYGCYIIDSLLVYTPFSFILTLVFGLSTTASPTTQEEALALIMGRVPYFTSALLGILILSILFEGVFGGTPGKLLCGYKVRRVDGSPLGIGRAIVRNVVKLMGIFTLYIAWLVIGLTEKKQGLHDFAAGTIVVDTQESPIAGFWLRFAAYCVDMQLFFLPLLIASVTIIGFLMGFLSAAQSPEQGFMQAFPYILLITGFLFGILWPILESGIGGTPGKRLLGLRIVRVDDGTDMGFFRAFFRNVFKILSALILCIGFFMIGWNAKKRGLHDFICGTYVVKDPR